MMRQGGCGRSIADYFGAARFFDKATTLVNQQNLIVNQVNELIDDNMVRRTIEGELSRQVGRPVTVEEAVTALRGQEALPVWPSPRCGRLRPHPERLMLRTTTRSALTSRCAKTHHSSPAVKRSAISSQLRYWVGSSSCVRVLVFGNDRGGLVLCSSSAGGVGVAEFAIWVG
jgi:hypothetical protein